MSGEQIAILVVAAIFIIGFTVVIPLILWIENRCRCEACQRKPR